MTMKPELSMKNPYWLEKHRFYELKHFCLQYPLWKKSYATIDHFGRSPENLALMAKTKPYADPTARCAMAKLYYSERMELVENAAEESDMDLAHYILEGIAYGYSYDTLQAQFNIPCSRDTYYDRYRKTFWILNRTRK